jgi:hypothetical protein
MIQCQEIVNRANFLLDAEGSDRYTWDRDFEPAINSSIEWLVSLFNSAFAEKKLTPEGLRELTYIRVFQTSMYSRFFFDSATIGHYLWTIIAIYPEITIVSPVSDPPPSRFFPISEHSHYCPLASYIESNYSCKRLTAQEYNQRNVNPFVAESSLITCDELKQYAYKEFGNYQGGYSYTGEAWEAEISPSVANDLVALEYLKYPTNVTAIGNTIEFPQNLTDFITEKVVNLITFKEGGQTLQINTTTELNQLTNLMVK